MTAIGKWNYGMGYGGMIRDGGAWTSVYGSSWYLIEESCACTWSQFCMNFWIPTIARPRYEKNMFECLDLQI